MRILVALEDETNKPIEDKRFSRPVRRQDVGYKVYDRQAWRNKNGRWIVRFVSYNAWVSAELLHVGTQGKSFSIRFGDERFRNIFTLYDVPEAAHVNGNPESVTLDRMQMLTQTKVFSMIERYISRQYKTLLPELVVEKFMSMCEEVFSSGFRPFKFSKAEQLEDMENQ